MRRHGFLLGPVVLLAFVSCAGSTPTASRSPAPATPIGTATAIATQMPGISLPGTSLPGASLKVSSIVSVPPSTTSGSSWTLPAGTKDIDVRVKLEGRARVTVSIEVTGGDGRSVHRDDQAHEVDGSLELTFPDVTLPKAGSYTLRLGIRGPGIHQSSRVSIRRG